MAGQHGSRVASSYSGSASALRRRGESGSHRASGRPREQRVSPFAKRLLGVSLGVAVLGALLGLYVAAWATSAPPTIVATTAAPSSGGTRLTLETVAAIGPKYEPNNPDWVSYLIKK